MAASALNPFVAACLLALVVAAGAARIEPAGDVDPDSQTMRPCHSNNEWSGHLCKDVYQASGFSRYDYILPNTATGALAQCCCCPKGYKGACLNVK
ncbi:unnamed protein product [Urochloa humidicola]